MSTKATLIFTPENEHWHEELSAKHNYGIDCERNQCIVLEFDGQHELLVDPNDENFAVLVKPDSSLGKEILSKFGRQLPSRNKACMSEWISVEDRLPEDDSSVIVWVPELGSEFGYCDTCAETGDEWFVDDPDREITHWMPPPKSPND